MFEQFRNLFQPIDNDKWLEYTSYFKKMQLPAKGILLMEGAVSKKFFIIEKGCIRGWFNQNGKDITTQFFFENNVVASIESFRKRTPSPITIECIEATTVWWIHKKDMDYIIEEIKDIPALRDMYINAIFERTFNYMRHFITFIKDTPQERYQALLKNKPQIVQRVPQHYIASYLGITTVHLSRIKSKIAKEKR